MSEQSNAVPAETPAVDAKVEGKVDESKQVADSVVGGEAPIAAVQKRKIKWGEAEKEVTFDEAVQLAQKAFGIEGKAREAAEKHAQAETLMQLLQDNPKEFSKRAKAAGLDANKLATEILYENIRLNSLTPEQRELEEYKAREAEAEAVKKEAEEAEKQKAIEAQTKEWSQKFESELAEAMKSQGLPKTRLAIALAAQYIDAGLKNKKELSVTQVLPYVLRDLKNIHADTMGNLDGEDLLAYLGEDITNKVAAARVARYKKGQSEPAVPAKPAAEPKKNEFANLKGKAYWSALRRQKSEAGIDAFPGAQ